MIFLTDDWRPIAFLGVIAAALLAVCAIISAATEPTCPAGSEAKHTRSGWFCVVPEVKP